MTEHRQRVRAGVAPRPTVLAVAVAAAALAAGSDARAQSASKGAFGVGLIVGEPLGVAAKLYLDDDNALAGAVGSAFVGGGLQVHVDYLWHPWILEERDSFVLVAYVGPGARLIYYDRGRDGSDFVAPGVRVVGGVVFDFRELPLDVFLEVAGVGEWRLGTEPDRGAAVTLNAGAGARYYF